MNIIYNVVIRNVGIPLLRIMDFLMMSAVFWWYSARVDPSYIPYLRPNRVPSKSKQNFLLDLVILSRFSKNVKHCNQMKAF